MAATLVSATCLSPPPPTPPPSSVPDLSSPLFHSPSRHPSLREMNPLVLRAAFLACGIAMQYFFSAPVITNVFAPASSLLSASASFYRLLAPTVAPAHVPSPSIHQSGSGSPTRSLPFDFIFPQRPHLSWIHYIMLGALCLTFITGSGIIMIVVGTFFLRCQLD